MKIDLPSGGWVMLRDDPERVTVRERQALEDAFDQADGTALQKGRVGVSSTLALLVEEWSFDLPLPGVNPDVLLDLSAHDYDTLVHAVAPLRQRMFVDFGPDRSPDSPT